MTEARRFVDARARSSQPRSADLHPPDAGGGGAQDANWRLDGPAEHGSPGAQSAFAAAEVARLELYRPGAGAAALERYEAARAEAASALRALATSWSDVEDVAADDASAGLAEREASALRIRTPSSRRLRPFAVAAAVAVAFVVGVAVADLRHPATSVAGGPDASSDTLWQEHAIETSPAGQAEAVFRSDHAWPRVVRLASSAHARILAMGAYPGWFCIYLVTTDDRTASSCALEATLKTAGIRLDVEPSVARYSGVLAVEWGASGRVRWWTTPDPSPRT